MTRSPKHCSIPQSEQKSKGFDVPTSSSRCEHKLGATLDEQNPVESLCRSRQLSSAHMPAILRLQIICTGLL